MAMQGGEVSIPPTAASLSLPRSPCPACKYLRRKCLPSCIFAHFFPPEHPEYFESAHRSYGAGRIVKILEKVDPSVGHMAGYSVYYEAELRREHPLYGYPGMVSFLQSRLADLKQELDSLNAPPALISRISIKHSNFDGDNQTRACHQPYHQVIGL